MGYSIYEDTGPMLSLLRGTTNTSSPTPFLPLALLRSTRLVRRHY